MVNKNGTLFTLDTKHTTYAFYINETGHPVHLYYGDRIATDGEALAALLPKYANQNGCSIIADEGSPNLCLDDIAQETSTRGKGDMKEPMVALVLADGSRTSDFRYEGYRIEEGVAVPEGLPGAYAEEGGSTLVLTLLDRNSGVRLLLYYSVFEECDCITRFARLVNTSGQPVEIERLFSAQLDLEAGAVKVVSFHGDWAREMKKSETVLTAGMFAGGTTTGFSSNRTNPFFMVGAPDVSETAGDCIGINLVYSGNHRESVEFGGHGKVRVMTGIHPDTFAWRLAAGESFDAPQAVLTYSSGGYREISVRMHAFVREHIVRGEWKRKERPVLLNSWEAAYFSVSEARLVRLAKAAKEDGIELFVLDDGWFGHRNDDKSSLGDWNDNKEKLPHGIAGLSKKIREMGLLFGIWVEPEMVSEDSELYRAHPDWAVRIPGQAHALGRNQMLLDLSRSDVQEFVIEAMSGVFLRGKVAYVKWDMNRHLSDYYSQGCSAEQQGEFSHRYVLGLYRVLAELTGRFPHILFEACASGGNRFDLGMLCYMPQIWASDNTDAVSRAEIQNGYSYGYPQSVYTAHVSASPNHQTLRVTPLATRYAVAGAAVLGYECNLCDLSAEERKEIREQVETYKRWRGVLQFGQLYRGGGVVGGSFGASGASVLTGARAYDSSLVRWTVVSPDRTRAVGILVQDQALPNYAHESFQTGGLDEEKQYRFYNRLCKYDIRRMGDLVNTIAPFHVKQDSLVHQVLAKFVKLDGEKEEYTVSGSLLNRAGVRLASGFAGTGYGANTRLYPDYDARVYYMEAVEE